MWRRWIVLGVLGVLGGCAGVAESAGSAAEEKRAGSSVAAVPAPPSAASTAWLGSCEARGLPVMDPCPMGATFDPGDVLYPEMTRFCCASGPMNGGEVQGCFAALFLAAEVCRDAQGEAAIKARVDGYAQKSGEPCRDPSWQVSPAFRRLCVKRGVPCRAGDWGCLGVAPPSGAKQ